MAAVERLAALVTPALAPTIASLFVVTATGIALALSWLWGEPTVRCALVGGSRGNWTLFQGCVRGDGNVVLVSFDRGGEADVAARLPRRFVAVTAQEASKLGT